MEIYVKTCIGVLIPFIGTTLGAGVVFFFKKTINQTIDKLLLGFAAGVMIAASIWSLLIPSIDIAKNQGKVAWIPATLGLITGTFFLIISKDLIYRIKSKNKEEIDQKTKMLILAVTLHNIPEGMAVGIAFASLFNLELSIDVAVAFTLSFGIAIQNFPEGATISLPLRTNGLSRTKSFLYGTLSGVVEPIAAILTIFLSNLINCLLPFLLAFAAGAMIYVVTEELIPESQKGKYSNFGTFGVIIGFTIMMILDVAVG